MEGLENLSAAYEISDAVEAGNPYSGGQTVSTFAQRFSDRALDQGLITLTAEGDQMSVDLPIADISGHPPERLAGQAVQAMENELDRITGTTVVERLEMDTPVGQQIDDGTLTLEGRDEQTHARYVELGTRLDRAIAEANSPLSGTPTSTLHPPTEIGFHDSRFYTTMHLSLDQIEDLLESRPVEDVVASLENLSAANEITAAVMSGDHQRGKDEVHVAAGPRHRDNALDHGTVRLHTDRDEMTVDVPIEPAHPRAEGFAVDAELLRDPHDRAVRPSGVVQGLQRHPRGPLS